MVDHAFEGLNLNRVWLTVFENNPRGVRAYEKAGFRVEGRLRQECFREGRYWDAIFMAICARIGRNRLEAGGGAYTMRLEGVRWRRRLAATRRELPGPSAPSGSRLNGQSRVFFRAV